MINDVSVAGVNGYGRTSDEKVPHAWIVLSKEGERIGAKVVIEELDDWHKENLSKYKWLRGGFEVMAEVCLLYINLGVFDDVMFLWLCSFRNRLLARRCGVNYRIDMKSAVKSEPMRNCNASLSNTYMFDALEDSRFCIYLFFWYSSYLLSRSCHV